MLRISKIPNMLKRNRVHSTADASPHAGSSASVSSAAELDDAIRQILNIADHQSGALGVCRGNPITRRGKRTQMAKMMVLTFIPIFALMAMTMASLSSISRDNEMKSKMSDTIRFSTQTGMLVHYLQRERDMTALHLSSLGAETRMFLKDRYPETDKALKAISRWPSTSVTKEFRSKNDFWSYLNSHRKKLDATKTDVYQEIDFYTNTIRTFIEWMYEGIQDSRDGDQWRALVAYQLLVVSKEDMGVERTLGGIFFSKGKFNTYSDYLWYLEKHNVGIGNYQAAKRFSSRIQEIFDEELQKYEGTNFTHHIEVMRKDISRNNMTDRNPSWEMSTWWFDNMSTYIDILFEIQMKMASAILRRLESSLQRDKYSVSVSIGLCVLVLFICPLVIVSIRAIINDIQKYAFTLADQSKALNRERKRTDSLLCQMLPMTVADQLKKNEAVEAESFDEGTIFLSDVVGFTRITSDCTPMQVIEMLNSLYKCFDSRLQSYDVYKVETIGDAYMIVSGVPERNGRQHVFEIAMLSLDLMHHITHLEIPQIAPAKLKLRIGIHSGPVVAGIVGSKMPRYCLFGDTVNIASRMESSGKPMKIHISQSTRDLLSFDKSFVATARGQMELEGKGNVITYWLDNKEGFEETLPCMPGCVHYKAAIDNFVENEDDGYENVTTLL
ncbi:uncharacterized protein LOC141915366 [Tubulanus polymorphus]|uniref:uncharacterized protein LOC141915366 n=1 Tax=Tubulanus polymorphus TaxID=672921 RepID=UPI003DA47BEF